MSKFEDQIGDIFHRLSYLEGELTKRIIFLEGEIMGLKGRIMELEYEVASLKEDCREEYDDG